MSKRLTVLTAFLFAAASVAGVLSAKAAAVVELLLAPADAAYYFIAEPVSLHADYSRLYVGGQSERYEFNREGTFVSSEKKGADGYATTGSTAFRLKDGTLYCGDTEVATGIGGIAADGDKLYAYKATGGLYAYDVADSTATNEKPVSEGTFNGVAAADGRIYVAVRKNSSVSGICELIDGQTVELDRQVWGVQKLTADEHALYVLAGGQILRYADGGRTTAYAPGVIDIACAGRLYALTYTGAVVEYTTDLSSSAEIIVSASASDGCFDSPQSAATRKDTVAVADTGNNRVTLITADGTSYIDYAFSQPVAAGMDDYGRIYVAHKSNLVEIFSRDGAHLDTVSCGDRRIRDLKIDSLDNVYLRADDGVYRLANETLTKICGAVDAITVLPDSDSLYVLQDDAVYAVENGALTKVIDVAAGSSDVALDLDGSVYAVNGGIIYKYDATKGYTQSYVDLGGYPLSDEARITLSTVENGLLEYGDIIVTDTLASAVKRIDGSAYGVKMIDETPPPVDADSGDPAPAAEGILYKIQESVDMYEYPRDMSPLYVLPVGTTVIATVYDIPGAPAYSYAVAEYGDRLVCGYVRKVRLKPADCLPYSEPVKDTAKIQNSGAKIYKYPSLYAPALKGYDSVAKDTTVELLRFAEAYRDCKNGRWYRVSVENGEGYIPAANLTINNYQPVFTRPQYNAVIIEAEGRDYAELFADTDGVVYLNQSLPAGTRVEVIGSFDPSKEYTHIHYFNESLGTLDCWVLTVHLKYKGVNAVQVVAVVLITLTVIAGIILFIWRWRVKRKKLA